MNKILKSGLALTLGILLAAHAMAQSPAPSFKPMATVSSGARPV